MGWSVKVTGLASCGGVNVLGWSVKVTGLASCVGVNVLGWSVKVTGLASCEIGWGNVLGWFRS